MCFERLQSMSNLKLISMFLEFVAVIKKKILNVLLSNLYIAIFLAENIRQLI